MNQREVKNIATLEQIIGEARALSPSEKRKLRPALDRELEEPAPPQSSKPSYRTYEREHAWLDSRQRRLKQSWDRRV